MSTIEVDGVLDEPAWQGALKMTIEYEWFPGDNVKPPVDTDVFLTYDDDAFYVGFVAYDPDPSAIRAHLMDRDTINTFVQDDHVSFMIDTFNDERRAFQFRINPLGVQADALFSQVEFIEDFSWDVIWDSAGRITAEGYVVEVALPLDQIRFAQTDGPQTWGIELSRSYPRDRRHRMSANPRDRDRTCLLCQVDKVRGFEGIEPGRNLEVTPTVTGLMAEARQGFPDGDFETAERGRRGGPLGAVGHHPGADAERHLQSRLLPGGGRRSTAQRQRTLRALLRGEEALLPRRRRLLRHADQRGLHPHGGGSRVRAQADGQAGRQRRRRLRHAETRSTRWSSRANQGSRQALIQEEVDGAVARYRRDIGDGGALGVLLTSRSADDYSQSRWRESTASSASARSTTCASST